MGDFSCLFFLDCVRLAGVVAMSGPFLLGIVGLAPEEAKWRWLGPATGHLGRLEGAFWLATRMLSDHSLVLKK